MNWIIAAFQEGKEREQKNRQVAMFEKPVGENFKIDKRNESIVLRFLQTFFRINKRNSTSRHIKHKEIILTDILPLKTIIVITRIRPTTNR